MSTEKKPESGLETTPKTMETPSNKGVQSLEKSGSIAIAESAHDPSISHSDYTLSSYVQNSDNSLFGARLTELASPDFLIEAKGYVTSSKKPDIWYWVIGIHYNLIDQHHYFIVANLQKAKAKFIQIQLVVQIKSASESPTPLSPTDVKAFMAAADDYANRVAVAPHDLRAQSIPAHAHRTWAPKPSATDLAPYELILNITLFCICVLFY